MPSVSDIKAGRAYVEIGANDSELVRTLSRDARQLQQWGSAIRGIGLQIAGAGAAVFAPLAAAGDQFAKHGEQLETSSRKTGLSVEATSTLGYAAQQTNTDAEALETGISKMSRTLAQAAAGGKQATAALDQVGLSVRDLDHLSQEDRLKSIADGIAGIEDPAARAAAAIGIFGRGGAQLLPLLTRGSAGISAMQAHARALGLQWSREDAAAGEKFSRVLKDMWAVLTHGADVIGSAVAPVLSRLATFITAAAVATTRWIGQHRELIATAAIVAGTFVLAGTALIALGTGISAVGVVLGTVASGLGLVASVLTAIVSPIGLLIAGLAIGTIAFFKFSKAGVDVGNSIIGAFRQVRQSIKFVFENTSTLSEAWAAAQAEAGLLIMESWQRVKGFLLQLWAGIKSEARDVWDSIGSAIAGAAYDVADEFLTIWAKAMHAWNSLTIATANAVNEVMGETAKEELARTLQGIDIKEKGGVITHEEAEHRRKTAHQTFDDYDQKQTDLADQQNDQQLQGKLDALKKAAGDRQAYLDGLRAKQRAANDQRTTEEIAANDKATAAATAAAKQAREAYEAELKRRHQAEIDNAPAAAQASAVKKGVDTYNAAYQAALSASERDVRSGKTTPGDARAAAEKEAGRKAAEAYRQEYDRVIDAHKSLADQFKAIEALDPNGGDDDDDDDDGQGFDAEEQGHLLDSVKHAKSFKAVGATNIDSQDLADQIFGFGGGEKKQPEEETAKNTREMKQHLKTIAGKGKLVFG